MTWVLKQKGDALDGWYWCGAGNPRFKQAYEATKYRTHMDAIMTAGALQDEGLGTFEAERYNNEVLV